MGNAMTLIAMGAAAQTEALGDTTGVRLGPRSPAVKSRWSAMVVFPAGRRDTYPARRRSPSGTCHLGGAETVTVGEAPGGGR